LLRLHDQLVRAHRQIWLLYGLTSVTRRNHRAAADPGSFQPATPYAKEPITINAVYAMAYLAQHWNLHPTPARPVAATTAAVADAKQRLDDWQRTGISSRADVIAAWKRAAARALAVAEAGRDPQAEVDRVEAMRHWALAQGHSNPDEDLPAEVEVVLRKGDPRRPQICASRPPLGVRSG